MKADTNHQPLVAVERAGRFARLAEELLDAEVARARKEGATWSGIAVQLGRTRQAVQQRFELVAPGPKRDAGHPGKGNPTAGALATQDIKMTCRVCRRRMPGKNFPTARRQRPGQPVREDRCRDCRDRRKRPA